MYRSDTPSTSQAQPFTTMGFEEKTLDFLTLLIAYAVGSSPTIVVVTRPPTPTATHTSTADAGDKNRKKAQWGKGAKGTQE